jgi:hypothetical protein
MLYQAHVLRPGTSDNIAFVHRSIGAGVSVVVEAVCYKAEGRGLETP